MAMSLANTERSLPGWMAVCWMWYLVPSEPSSSLSSLCNATVTYSTLDLKCKIGNAKAFTFARSIHYTFSFSTQCAAVSTYWGEMIAPPQKDFAPDLARIARTRAMNGHWPLLKSMLWIELTRRLFTIF